MHTHNHGIFDLAGQSEIGHTPFLIMLALAAAMFV
jgi:hypothetical protein